MSAADVVDVPPSFARALLERAATEECATLALAGARVLTMESSEARSFALLEAVAALHQHAGDTVRRYLDRGETPGPAVLESFADDARELAAALSVGAAELYRHGDVVAAERPAPVEGSDAR